MKNRFDNDGVPFGCGLSSFLSDFFVLVFVFYFFFEREIDGGKKGTIDHLFPCRLFLSYTFPRPSLYKEGVKDMESVVKNMESVPEKERSTIGHCQLMVSG